MKKYDIVETSKMAMEYDGSLIDVEKTAKTDLENGRVAVVKGKEVEYAAKGEKGEVFLINSVERMADTTKGLTEFINLAGEKVRITRFRNGDIFKTTAFTGTVAEGDYVLVDANGTFKKGTPTDEKIKFVVNSINCKLGFSSVSFGFDGIPAIELKIEM